jgi:hypothetical protein
MDLNLDTLKREILEYLAEGGFAVFHSSPGGLEGMPMVLWDSEKYPDYQMFLAAAKKVDAGLIVFAAREFDAAELDESSEQLDECDFTREERRDMESRLREMRVFEGVTCTIELAFDYQSRLYVYEVRPDWYEEFLGLADEIDLHTPTEANEDDGSLGGYFSKN